MGEIIRNKRIDMNLSLEALASLIGCSISELSAIETGRIRNPSSVFLFRLSKILDIDYNEMLSFKYASFYRMQKLYGFSN